MIRRGAQRAFFAAITLASLLGTGTSDARPRRHDARAAFDRGVAAYQKGNYEAAAEALGKSFELEDDVDTLFAWAQAERKLERCDKALELYEMLLSYALPPVNKLAVEQKLAECRAILAHDPAPPAAPGAPATAPEALPAAPSSDPAPAAGAVAAPRSAGGPPGVRAGPAAGAPDVAVDTGDAPRAWYREPVALTLLGTGAAAGAAGTWLLLSAQSMSNDAKSAGQYQKALDLRNTARQRGVIGAVSAISGGALVAGGIAWILLRSDHAERHTVSGWLAPGGGGLAIGGPF